MSGLAVRKVMWWAVDANGQAVQQVNHKSRQLFERKHEAQAQAEAEAAQFAPLLEARPNFKSRANIDRGDQRARLPPSPQKKPIFTPGAASSPLSQD